MWRYFFYLWLVIVVDPYKDLNYDIINVYHINKRKFNTLGMSIVTPESVEYDHDTYDDHGEVKPPKPKYKPYNPFTDPLYFLYRR